jgi:hypothetical protein
MLGGVSILQARDRCTLSFLSFRIASWWTFAPSGQAIRSTGCCEQATAALGLEGGLEPLIWRESVPVAASPLEWLQRGADGICPLDYDAPELCDLFAMQRLVCSSLSLANLLKRSLTKPVRLPSISVGVLAHAS